MKDDVENASSGVDSCDNAAVDAKSKGIINFRGMELAMVKVIHYLSPFITTHVHMTFIRQYSLYADLLFESIGFEQVNLLFFNKRKAAESKPVQQQPS